jgi:hypothetical protein
MNEPASLRGCLWRFVTRRLLVPSSLVLGLSLVGCGDNLPVRETGKPKGSALFFDDFETGDPRKWTPVAGNWQVPGIDGVAKEYATLEPSLSVAIAGSAAWTNYEVRARMTIGAEGSSAGVLGRVQGKHHYYALSLGTDAARVPSWSLVRRSGHTAWTTLASGPFAYKAGAVYVLRLVMNGASLEGSISSDNGKSFMPLGKAEDATWASGKIGLTSAGATALFDDVSVFGDLLDAPVGPWGWLVELRDDTLTFPGKPAGGWYVAPIHVTLMPRTGKVLITGFGRKAEADCPAGTTRQVGETFVLDPNLLDSDVEFITPLNEQNNPATSDVLYCSGHNPLADGRIFYSGGTRYNPPLPFHTSENGIDYSRLYDSNTGAITRINFAMQGGPATSSPKGKKWYPTNMLLPDGTTLIFGGFTSCCSEANRSLELFDPRKFDLGQNPYTLQVDHSAAPTDTHPTQTYTNMYVLPTPVNAAAGNGFARTVFLIGGPGRAYLYNHEPGTPTASRHFARSLMPAPTSQNGARAWKSTSAPLADGRVLVANGSNDAATASSFRIYDPTNDTWTANTPLGILRANADAVLLPDGTVMLVNGDEDAGPSTGLRNPQIIDPATGGVTTLPPWPDPEFRGFHAFALLLKDGRILIGGGKDHHHEVGCERADVQLFDPPYLALPDRPGITNVTEGQSLVPGGAAFTVTYSGGPVRTTAGVVLMAPGSMTHSFDFNQRYVPLAYTEPSAGTLSVSPPANINVAPPGDYVMFLVGQNGAVSTGVWVRVPPPTCLYAVDGNAAFTYVEAELPSRSSGPFVTVTDGSRSGGAYREVTEGSGSHTSAPDEGKVMWYDLDVTNGGSFNLWFSVQGPDTSSDSFWVSIDGGPDSQLTAPAAWTWVQLPTTFSLPTGKHSLKVKVGEDGARVDKIALTKATSTPTDAGAAIVCGCLAETDPTFCARLGTNCGTVVGTDNCGAARTVASCGTCTLPQFCGGGGPANVCGGCIAETDAAFCARHGANCGTLSGTDTCGLPRTVASCGTCTSPNTCGGGSVANVCGSADLSEGGTVTSTGTACNANETAVKAYDNLMTSANFTKWCVTQKPTTSAAISSVYDFAGSTAFVAKRYTITTANDIPGRDPKNWTFQACQASCTVGSNTGWITLDTRSNQFIGAARFQTNTYTFVNTTAYQKYRLRITANNGASTNMQLAEIQMFSN